MKLYGTSTSPYVRRVRFVAQELGVDLTLVDTSTDGGQAALRLVTPLWKVPVAEVEDQVIFDSHQIINFLIERYGIQNLRIENGSERWRERNLMNAIDGALDSAINSFYLRRDGANVEEIAYCKKQRDRVESVFNWLEKQLQGIWFTDTPRYGLSEIGLKTALDWMIFREAYPVARHSGLVRFRDAHGRHPSFSSTTPGS